MKVSCEFDWEKFRRVPIVAIARGFQWAEVVELARAAGAGGVRNIEVTMDTPGAEEQIRTLRSQWSGHGNVGAGTVTSLERLKRALEAGASFIVTPTLNVTVLAECVNRGIPIFPGVWTPNEAVRASEAGASLVKIFPSETFGNRWVRELHEEFPQIGLLPTGGVDLDTMEEYVAAGASGFGVGSPLFNKARVTARDWAWVESRSRAMATKAEGLFASKIAKS